MINELASDVTFVGSSAPVAPQTFQIKTPAGFPFSASHVFVANDGGGTIRCALTTALSTGTGLVLTTGQSQFWNGLQSGCSASSLITTSSSTSGFSVRVAAWG